jgi:hypothetical protein
MQPFTVTENYFPLLLNTSVWPDGCLFTVMKIYVIFPCLNTLNSSFEIIYQILEVLGPEKLNYWIMYAPWMY